MARNSQQGVALITVLLVFALVTVLAAQIMNSAYFSVRQSANAGDTKQAFFYALGAEALGRQLLARDIIEQPQSADALNELWASHRGEFDIAEGRMELTVRDANSRFNINNLVNSDGIAQTVFVDHFKSLLQSAGLDQTLASAVVDWLDQDSHGDAENSYYQSLPEPYLAANQRIADISELRLIKGIDDAAYQQLKPLVVALPKASSYNVNTLNPALLPALGLNLSAEAFSAQQATGGWQNLADFSRQYGAAFAGSQLMATQSDYFEVLVVAEFNNRFAKLRTLVHRARPEGTITVLSRVMDPTLLFEDERYDARNTGN